MRENWCLFLYRNWLKINYRNSKDHKKVRKFQAQLSQLKLHQVYQRDLQHLHQHFQPQTQESWKVTKEPNLLQVSWIPLSVLKKQTRRQLNLVTKYLKRWLLLLINNMTQHIWLLNACHQFQNPIMALFCKTALRTQERISLWSLTMLTSKAPIQDTWENQMDAFSTIENFLKEITSKFN